MARGTMIQWIQTSRLSISDLLLEEVLDGLETQKQKLVDNLLVRIRFIIEMIRWTGLALTCSSRRSLMASSAWRRECTFENPACLRV